MSSIKVWIDTAGVDRTASLFGIAPLERLRRTVRQALPKDIAVVVSGPAVAGESWPDAVREVDDAPVGERLRRALAAHGPLVALEGATVVDPRLVRFLAGVRGSRIAQRRIGDARALALRIDPAAASAIPAEAPSLAAVADALEAAGAAAAVDDDAFPSYIDKLRRSLPYWLYRVEDRETRDRLQRKMFRDNYKASTDLLTAYVYPPLVWPLVRLCARLHVHPNAVTVLSIILAFAAVPLFAEGRWIPGFVCAYAMSVLDSVDGKLARLTLADSKIGNILDHGLDQVHPPIWYVAWAWGLGARDAADPLYAAALWLVGLYFADRIVLGIGRKRLGHALHATTRLDEIVRGIIARRNITMTILAIALLVGAGRTGFYVVVSWQAATVAWHGWRTLWLGFLHSPQRVRRTG